MRWTHVGRDGLGAGRGGWLFGEDEVRCARERKRGRKGGEWGFPHSPRSSLCSCAQRERRSCGEPRERPAAAATSRIRDPPHPCPAASPSRCSGAPLRPRPAATAPSWRSCIPAQLPMRSAAAAPNCISAPLTLRPAGVEPSISAPLPLLRVAAAPQGKGDGEGHSERKRWVGKNGEGTVMRGE